VTLWLRVVGRDVLTCAAVAAIALVLGLGSNMLRSHPLPLFENPSEPGKQTMPVGSIETVELERLAANHAAVLIDVRPYDFFANGHVLGARNIPLADLQMNPAEALAKLTASRDIELALYCSDSTCPAAEAAARILISHGFRHVVVFTGGWQAWTKAGLPVEMTP
jgi:rhodanese-related sulfurtransferase